MVNMQVRLDERYNDKLMDFCQRNGATKSDVIRFMIDTLELTGALDDEFDRWFENTRR